MVENIAALNQEEFEKELGLMEAGWKHAGQKFEPMGYFGGGMLQMHAVAETYKRLATPNRDNHETIEFWWISSDNIGKVIKGSKLYPNPSEEVIRMLVK